MFFGAFLGPIIAILLFNVAIFFIVIFVLIRHTMGKISHQGDKLDRKTAFRLLSGIFGITSFLGLTWLFGAFTIADASFAFQLLFTIFNTLQGFFIFVFFCVLNNDTQEAWVGFLSSFWCKAGQFRPFQPKYLTGTTPTNKDASKYKETNLESDTLPFKQEYPEPGCAVTGTAAVAIMKLVQAVPGGPEGEEEEDILAAHA